MRICVRPAHNPCVVQLSEKKRKNYNVLREGKIIIGSFFSFDARVVGADHHHHFHWRIYIKKNVQAHRRMVRKKKSNEKTTTVNNTVFVCPVSLSLYCLGRVFSALFCLCRMTKMTCLGCPGFCAFLIMRTRIRMYINHTDITFPWHSIRARHIPFSSAEISTMQWN